MPRFMSPLRPRYMRSPSDIPQEGLKITPTPQQAETSSANANNESQEQQEPEYPEARSAKFATTAWYFYRKEFHTGFCVASKVRF